MEQKLLSIGKKYYIRDEHGNDLFFARMEKFKLKPKIFIYSDDTQSNEVLTILPRNILDACATYDVVESKSKAHIGSFKRQGLHSLLQNKWNILDTSGNIVGTAQETAVMAVFRRLVMWWKLDFEIDYRGQRVGSLNRAISIRDRYTLDLGGDPEKKLDRRMAIAMLTLFDAGEYR